MSNETTAAATVEENAEERYYQPSVSLNRNYVPLKERLTYIIKTSVAGMGLGKFDVGSDIFMYQIYVLSPLRLQKARGLLVIYDMINDPLTAAIIDNMRTRWGKFKPFQYLSVIPSTLLGIITCFLPIIASIGGFDETKRLMLFMGISFASETISALFSGGGYIDNVFTPNPNERTQLLTISKFMSEIYSKAPELIVTFIFDLYDDGLINGNIVTIYVSMKTIIWLIVTIPGIFWVFLSRERVAQSVKPPNPISGITSVFRNAPLLICTLSGAIDSISIGTSESLYFRNVLGLNTFGAIFGIPGSPISFISYGLVPKLRAKYSTKTLWFFQRGSVFASELGFFLVGAIGKRAKTYERVGVMGTAYMLGNCLEMFFYGLKKIITTEISYEVQDYCEWKNGFRVEATQSLITAYIGKVQGYLLGLLNAWILEAWTGFEAGISLVTDDRTKYRLFLMAYGPRLIPDFLCMIPMLFYNLTGEKRDKMYEDLMERRSAMAAMKGNEDLKLGG